MRNVEKEIREDWFKDHKAELKDFGQIQILEWAKPGTGIYRVRYIFDENMMYVSGDVGEAVFRLTWKAGVHSFNDLNLGYFIEKLRAFCDERWNYSGEKAEKRLKEWRKGFINDITKYDEAKLKKLMEVARGCSSQREWAEVVNGDEYNDFIGDLDSDYWEWFYNIGNVYPPRLRSYLIGLQMASEQIKREVPHDTNG